MKMPTERSAAAGGGVLAVMKRLAEHTLTGEKLDAEAHMEACRAHDAVAELIAAARAFAPAVPVSKREIRLCAALSNIEGGK